MILIEPICNASSFLSMPKFITRAAAERYLSYKGFVPTEDISLENVIMLCSYDTEIESVPGADGESVILYVKPIDARGMLPHGIDETTNEGV